MMNYLSPPLTKTTSSIAPSNNEISSDINNFHHISEVEDSHPQNLPEGLLYEERKE
jgi:hypothetical protein